MEKLLAIATLGQRAYGRWLFQRLVVRTIIVVGLIFIIAIMSSALLLGLLFVAYTALLQYGMAPFMAMLIISILALLGILFLVLLAWSCLRRLRQLPRTLFKQSPFTSRLSDTLDAFMDGFMEK